MKFDRNTVIGLIILAGLFIGFFVITNNDQAKYRKEQAKLDSIANANKPKADPLLVKTDSLHADSMHKAVVTGIFNDSTDGKEEITYAENKVFKIAFTNKGAQPKWIELKNFKNMDSGHVKLANGPQNRISYKINTGAKEGEGSASTADLFFKPGVVSQNPDGSATVTFTKASTDSSGATSIIHQYTLKPDDYMVDFDVQLNGGHLLSNGVMNINWEYTADQQESDITFEKRNTQIGYVEDDEFDYHTIGNKSSLEFSKPVKWLGVRQRFFNTFLIAKTNFRSGKMTWNVPADEKKVIVQSSSDMQVEVPASGKTSFSIFYGPADFHTLKKEDLRLEKLINLGQGPYAFVRPLNRYVVMPVWDFIKGFVGSYGLVIALLTLFIRLVISPLSYKSYLSGAKMKALRPEIAALKEKHGADQQAMSVDQMKLFREAGVNPLGGCIPALLQIPIFFALYSFFSSNVDLRGADFLWAKDLSAFDDLITSLLISLYSMSLSPDQSNPVLKYMPYIFPVFLLFIFNTLPSALTWYYTVSNIVTLILQFVIQNYIIDHNKILTQISENRKKPKTKSKWAERMEQMQEQQKKMKEMQKKGKK